MVYLLVITTGYITPLFSPVFRGRFPTRWINSKGLRWCQEGHWLQAVALPRGGPFAGHRQGDLHDRPMGRFNDSSG